jgi:transposase-like protein
VEIDESYFGRRRVRGNRGRGTDGKTIVFGIFKRNGRVYTEIVSDCRKKAMQRRSGAAWNRTPSSIPTAGGGTTD